MAIKTLYRLMLWASLAIGIASCGVKRFIPEDEVLYTGASLKVEAPKEVDGLKEVRNELRSLMTPTPNTTFLGMRPGLYFHYKVNVDSAGFPYKWLNRKFGESPVYLSGIDPQFKEELILNRLDNNGFFYSRASSQIDSTRYYADISYTAELSRPYTMETYSVDGDSIPIYGEVRQMVDATPVEPGTRFDLEFLKFERERIDNGLKRRGYYNFNPQFLIFEADTNQYDNRKFDLYLRLKRNVPQKSVIPYTIDSISVYPNYSLGEDGDVIEGEPEEVESISYIQDPYFFKPRLLSQYMLLEKGQRYDADIAARTADRLSDLGSYKYVNIRFEERDTLPGADGTGSLHADIFLSPLNRRSLRAELRAVTKSNGFTGPGIAVTYSNRNLFRGGETLNLIGDFSYEAQLASGSDENLQSIAGGLELELIVPRLIPISPGKFTHTIPKTRASIGVDFLNRSKLYSLISFNSSFGYTWQENRFVYHSLNPISVSYSDLSNTSEEFERILDENPFLARSFEQQFIAGLNYSFTYNELVDKEKELPLFFNANFDTAGNLLNLISGDGKSIFGTEFAQYAKADVDFRYYFRWGSENALIARIFAGLGVPYGNSTSLPFVKQYFSGGPYSVRAFNIRSLGPGTYDARADGNISYFDQSGNLRLEGNLEYRFPIFSYVKGAFFVDAGNVWLTNAVKLPEDSPLQNTELGEELFSKGKFSSDWVRELGVGMGFGVRVDIQNFVIRFDLASPMRVPYLPEGERGRIPFFDGGSNNLTLNFAIGYPF